VNKFVIVVILSLLLLAPGVLAVSASTHSVRGDLQSFTSAFQSLFNADPDGMIDGLVGAMPLFGLILVVYAFAFFLGVLTIFNHKDHRRYANMVAIGLSLLGLAQQKVYDAILSWSTTFITITFMLAIVFMIIMFINNNRRRHFETNREMFDSQKSYLTAKKDAKKIAQDFYKDKKLYNKEERDLEHVDNELDDFDHLMGDELQIIDKISSLLERVSAHKDSPHKYVDSLRNHVGALMNRLTHEQHDYRKIDAYVDKLTKEFADWGYDESDEAHSDAHLIRMLKHHASSRGLARTKKDAETTAWLHGTSVEAKDVKRILANIRSELAALRHINRKLATNEEGPLHRYGPDVKHYAAIRFREAAFNGDYKQANNELDHLRNIILKERHVISQLHHINNEINMHLSRIHHYETQLHSHMAHIAANF